MPTHCRNSEQGDAIDVGPAPRPQAGPSEAMWWYCCRMCPRGTACPELDGVPEVCSQLLWTLGQPHTGSKIWLLPSFRVLVAALETRTQNVSKFSFSTAAREVQKVARPCPSGRTGWRGPPHELHFCFPMFKFTSVCCRRSAGCLVSRLWLGDRGIVFRVLAGTRNFF
jgi:hypothetical protein